MAIRRESDRKENRKKLKALNNSDYDRDLLIEMERELLHIETNETVYIDVPFQIDYGTNIHFDGGFYANTDYLFLDTSDISFGKGLSWARGSKSIP